jgi:hypothetical protein
MRYKSLLIGLLGVSLGLGCASARKSDLEQRIDPVINLYEEHLDHMPKNLIEECGLPGILTNQGVTVYLFSCSDGVRIVKKGAQKPMFYWFDHNANGKIDSGEQYKDEEEDGFNGNEERVYDRIHI